MVDSNFDFVDVVVADRNLVLTRSGRHECRVESRASDLTWYCDLDDGTPTDSDRDPAASVTWVCPALRTANAVIGTTVPEFGARRTGPHSDLGKLLKGFGRLAGRALGHPPEYEVEGRYAYTDPAGILDAALLRRLENWPSAPHGDGVVRPAELWSITSARGGLTVHSTSWWGSAPALDHQIGLALEIAHRLRTPR